MLSDKVSVGGGQGFDLLPELGCLRLRESPLHEPGVLREQLRLPSSLGPFALPAPLRGPAAWSWRGDGETHLSIAAPVLDARDGGGTTPHLRWQLLPGEKPTRSVWKRHM